MKKLAVIFSYLNMFKNYLNGNFAYQKYLEHHEKSCNQLLDKKSFLRYKEKEKWNKINRCC